MIKKRWILAENLELYNIYTVGVLMNSNNKEYIADLNPFCRKLIVNKSNYLIKLLNQILDRFKEYSIGHETYYRIYFCILSV